MKVLLFSMPDAMPMFNPEAWRPPNLGTASLAANAPDHDVRCADLIVKREDVTGAVHEAMDEVKPDLVGFSITRPCVWRRSSVGSTLRSRWCWAGITRRCCLKT